MVFNATFNNIQISIVATVVSFLAPLAKDNVSFCHRLASIVCCLLSVVR
jgi:hypothetical protein